MPEIDELLIRLSMDLRPFKNSLATRRHRRLLEAVNKGNRLRGFADGGLIRSGVPEIPPIQRGVTVPPQVALAA